MACDHYKNGKFYIHWGKMEYTMPIKRDTKESLLYLFRRIFLKGWKEL